MLHDVRFTILTNRVKPADLTLPPNVSVVTVPGRLGSFYYGIADYRFAWLTLRRYPPAHAFWKQFDVIHLNQTLGLPFLRLRGCPVPTMYFIHHPVSADRSVALEESAGWERWLWRLKYLLPVWSQGRLARGIAHVTTVSKTAAERIARDYGRDAASIAIVPNGVDAKRFVPGESDGTEFDVIALGSFIHPRKGFPYLLDLYRRLGSQGRTIADVGRRSAEQETLLRQIPGVRRLGTVDDRELPGLLRHSRCLVSTSLYEGFGLSIIEALACGKPAFAFDAGAVREVLTPIDPSLVVPIRDTEALATKITTCLESPEADRQAKGREYRRRVTELYSLQASADALQALYRSIVR